MKLSVHQPIYILIFTQDMGSDLKNEIVDTSVENETPSLGSADGSLVIGSSFHQGGLRVK